MSVSKDTYLVTENTAIIPELEANLIAFAKTLYANRYKPDEFAAHEISECMRRGFVYRKFYDQEVSRIAAYHFANGHFLENGFERALISDKAIGIEREVKLEGKRYGKYKLISHLDFTSRLRFRFRDKIFSLGVIELKTTRNFAFMPNYNVRKDGREWNIGFKAKVKYPHKPLYYERNKGPFYSHLDRMMIYMFTKPTPYTRATIIYISKMMLEGLVPFHIIIAENSEAEIRRKIDELANTYASYLERLDKDTRSIDEMAADINNIPATPGTFCQSCVYGGYLNHSIPFSALDPRYPNYCNTTKSHRQYQYSVFEEWTRKKPEHYAFDDLIFIKYINPLHVKINSMIIKHYRQYYDLDSLRKVFDCPRKVKAYKEQGIENVLLSTPHSQNIAVWMWRQECIISELVPVLDPDYRIDEFEFDYKGETYRQMMYHIKGVPTLIIPTTSIGSEEWQRKKFPYDIHVKLALLYLAYSKEKLVRILYYGITTTDMIAFDITVKHARAFSELQAEIKDKLERLKTGEPTPDLICMWCPLAVKKDNTGNYVCPEGYNWLKTNRPEFPFLLVMDSNMSTVSHKKSMLSGMATGIPISESEAYLIPEDIDITEESDDLYDL